MNKRSSITWAVCAQLLICMSGFAQNTKDDSLRLRKEQFMTQAALRYPTLRMAMVQVESVGKMDYTSRLHGNNFLTGTMRPKTVVKGFVTLPVYTDPKQEFSATLAYYRVQNTLTNTVNHIPQSPVNDDDYFLQTLSLLLNYKRVDSLFGRPLIWGASFITYSSLQHPVSKVAGFLYGIFPIRTTGTTRIAAGLLVSVDPTSITPVVPTFSYWHKFSRSPWEISIDLPTRAVVRRTVLSKGLLSLGTELSANTIVRNIDQPLFPEKAQFVDLGLKSGVTFEYPIMRKVLIGCSGGILSTLQNRVLGRYTRISHYDVSTKRDAAPYLNISISILR